MGVITYVWLAKVAGMRDRSRVVFLQVFLVGSGGARL